MAASDAGDHAVLREDDRGIPQSLRLLAALVESDALRNVGAASRPAGTDLVRAFRGCAAPAVPIRGFLERIHLPIRWSEEFRRVVRIDGVCYVLAGIYLARFLRSPAAQEAGILVEPATVHRLVAAALFLGAKFGGHAPRRWTAVFEASSDRAICASEMAGLEERFLRAIRFRPFADGETFRWFCGVLKHGPPAPRGSCVGDRKRKVAEDGTDDERRRVRSCRPPPPPAVAAN